MTSTQEWIRDLQGTLTDRYAVPDLKDDPTAKMLGLVEDPPYDDAANQR